MKMYALFTTWMTFLICMNSTPSLAGGIEKGTLSIGGSTDAFFRHVDCDSGSDSTNFFISSEIGYFFYQNIEIGTSLAFEYLDFDDGGEGQRYILKPFVRYHIPINQKLNLYIGGGGGIGRYEWRGKYGDDSTDTTSIFAQAGWEYAITKMIAFDFGVFAEHTEYGFDDDDDPNSFKHEMSEKVYGSEIKVRIYF